MTWLRALELLNLLVSLGSALAAAIAVTRPAALSHSASVSAGERFYAQMYTARSIPMGLVAGFVPLISGGPVAIVLLLTAGIIQAADVAIATANKDWRMAWGALVGTIVPLGLCYVLLRTVSAQHPFMSAITAPVHYLGTGERMFENVR